MDERVEEVLRRHSYKDEDFGDLDLSTHDLTRRWVTRCSFAGADLRHATLDGSFFTMCDFSKADLRAASLRGASFGGCSFRSADLRDADLNYVRLSRVDTGDPERGITVFTGAKLDGARLDHAAYDDSTVWPAGFTPPEPT